MSVLVDEMTRVLVQGVGGGEARRITEQMVAYGTPVVAGVARGRGGSEIAGVPVYETVGEAAREHRPNATLIAVTPGAVLDACLEALSHGIHLLLIATEGVPAHDMERVLGWARDRAARVIGPSSAGVINPAARVKLGPIGDGDAARIFPAGQVGVIARGGAILREIGLMTRRLDIGVSTGVSVGAEAPLATPPSVLLPLFERDLATEGVVLVGALGTRAAAEIATVLQERRYTKPLIVALPRPATGPLPEAAIAGYAAPLRDAGALVAEDFGDLIQYLSLTFRNAPYIGPLDL